MIDIQIMEGNGACSLLNSLLGTFSLTFEPSATLVLHVHVLWSTELPCGSSISTSMGSTDNKKIPQLFALPPSMDMCHYL